MPMYSVAAIRPGNVLVEAYDAKEAIKLAEAGGGYWEEDVDGCVTELVYPVDVMLLEE